MKIYNKDKTRELLLEECDLGLGYLKLNYEDIKHDAVEEVIEQGHYEVVQEYPNGGKDVEWVIDIPGAQGQEAWIERVEYQIYIPYSEAFLQKRQYENELKGYQTMLNNTDYKAIKYAEGWYTEEEYEPMKTQRESYRIAIRRLEAAIAEIILEDEEVDLQ